MIINKFVNFRATLDPLPSTKQIHMVIQSTDNPEDTVTWNMSVGTAEMVMQRLGECLNEICP